MQNFVQLAILALACAGLSAQSVLLQDINPQVNDSTSQPLAMTRSGNKLFFGAVSSGQSYAQPWVSDGTAIGTTMLRETNNGSPTAPQFVPFGTGVIFRSGSTEFGNELWVSDGTTPGTVQVIDLNTGPADGVGLIVGFNGKIVFAGNDGSDGWELWESDGTAAGTSLLKDIESGSGSSNPADFNVVGSQLFFTATTSTEGEELWVTDGTAAGTQLVLDINSGTASSNANEFTAVGSDLYFSAFDGTNGGELWISDGTSGGTTMVADIETGSGSSSPKNITALPSGNIVFSADTTAEGRELWTSDGTSAGTQLIANLNSGNSSSNPSYIVSMGSYLLFSATGTTVGNELWRTDGTSAGTTLVKDLVFNPTGSGSAPQHLTRLGNECLFYANAGTQGVGLWKTDGTALGTVWIHAVSVFTGPQLPIVELNGNLYFAGGDTGFIELWRTDATRSGTYIVKDLRRDAEFSDIRRFGEFAGGWMFWAENPTQGLEPWVSDGTYGGTQLLKDIRPGASDSYVLGGASAQVGSVRVFTANDGSNGAELWVTDGTTAGTTLLLDIYPGGNESRPQDFREMSGLVYFTALDPTNGRELWVTDGTVAGTNIVADILPGPTGSAPDELTVLGNTLFFNADDGVAGRELWKSDGTAAGTVLVKDLRASGDSIPEDLIAFGSGFLFRADDGVNGEEPWISDGTSAGTLLLADIRTGSGSSSVSWLTVSGGYAYFRATEPTTGTELWRTDGTGAGTIMLADANPGTASGSPFFLGQFGAEVVLSVTTATNGREAWITDGTVAGTSLLSDIYAGATDSSPRWMGDLGTRFLISAEHPNYGREIWISDGTTIGTTLLTDIFPGEWHGVGGSPFGYVATIQNKVYFNGTTANEGTALWETDGTVAGTQITDAIVPGPQSVQVVPIHVTGTRLFMQVIEPTFGREPWTVDFGSTNQAPVVSVASTGASFVEDAAAVALDPGVTITDADSTNFAGGFLRLTTVQGVSADDRVTIPNQGTGGGQVGISGNTVSVGGFPVATFSGGVGTQPLLVVFGSTATPADAETILRAIEFEILSDTPSNYTRVIEVVANDGDGGTSSAVSLQVTITPVNDAPVIDLAPISMFSGSPGGPFSAVLQPTIPSMVNMDLVVSDADTTPSLTGVSVSPSSPPSMNPPTAPQTLSSMTILTWTGNTAQSLPGTYTWTLTINDGGTIFLIDVSITIPDVAPVHQNGADSSGPGTQTQPYFSNSYVGTAPSRWMTRVEDPCTLQTVSLVSVTPAVTNPSAAFAITMPSGTGQRDVYATPSQTLVPGDIGTHEFTVVVTDGTQNVTFYLQLEVYPAQNQPPDIDVPAGSQFIKDTTAPTTSFSMEIDPTASVNGISSLQVNDPNMDDVEITAVSAPSPAPTSIAISYAPGLQNSGYIFEFTGTAESFDLARNYEWQITVEDQFGNSENFLIYIRIRNLPPGHVPGFDATSGVGTQASPYVAVIATGSSLNLHLVGIIDANTSDSHFVANTTPQPANPTGLTISIFFNTLTDHVVANATGQLDVSDIGSYVFEVTVSDGPNSIVVWVQIDVIQGPGGGGGGGGGSGSGDGGDDAESCSSSESRNSIWAGLLAVLIILVGCGAFRPLQRAKTLG